MATKEAAALDRLLAALAALDRVEYHVVGRTNRITCGGRSYAIGFSPCELAADRNGEMVSSECTAYAAGKRFAVKRAARQYAAVS